MAGRIRFVQRLGAALVLVSAGEVQANWTTLAPLNIARQETGAARIGDVVYVCGGLLEGMPFTNTNTVEAYHISSNTWALVAPMPLALDHMAAAALDGKFYVIGGHTRESDGAATARAEMNVYDPESGTWSSGPPLPAPRGAAWAAAHGGKIYVFGGVAPGVGARADTFIYDPLANTWSSGAPMPTAREHLNAVSDGAYLYVIGGRAGGVSTNANERYDPVTDTWASLSPMPTARAATVCAYLHGQIHCAGGESPMLFSAHEVYDIASNTWSALDPMAMPRHGVAAVVIDGGILAAGGGVVQGLQPTTHVDLFGPIPPGAPVERLAGLILLAAAVLLAGAALAGRKRTAFRPPRGRGAP